jgi:hypothetical protein
MADVSGKFFSAVKVRTGVSPSSPGSIVGEPLEPVNPPGAGLSSVGITMPSAFAVANSPLTSNGTIEITGAGTIAQYVRGDGTLETFPSLTGFVPYTGATQNVDLGEFGIDAGFVQLDTTPTNTPTTQGTIFWDADDETIDVILNGYIMKIGEDQFYPVKNQTGSSIAKGTAVRFAGTVGASSRLLIAPFIADGSVSSSFFMGVTAEAIADGADGKVLYFGRIRGINTNAFNEGDVLYASTTVAGGFQTAVPVAPNNIVQVAAVINKSINQGVIFIRPSFGSNINQDEGVKIVSPTTGQLLQLQANGLWENKTTAQVLGGTSSQFVKGDGTLDSNTYQVTSEKGQPNGYASLDSNGKVPLVQINDALIGNVNFQGLWNASTNTPTLANPPASGTKGHYYIVSTAGTFAGISFEVGDWIISDGTAWGKVDNTDAVSSVFGRTGNVTAANGDYTTAQVTESGNLYYTDGRARAAISLTTTGASGSSTYNNSTGVLNVPAYTLSGLGGIGGTIAAGQVAFGTAANTVGGDNGLFWDNTNKRLGIGTETPDYNFQVNGSIRFGSSTTLANNTYFDNTTFRLGLGVISPTRKLDVLDNGSSLIANFRSTSGNISAISLSNNASTADQVRFGSNGGNLTLSTNFTERFRIFSNGNIGINTTTDAGFRLDVNGTARVQGALSIIGNIDVLAGGVGSSFNRQISLGSGTAYNYQVRANDDDFQLREAGSHVFLAYTYGGSLGTGTIRLYNNTVSTASFTGTSFIRSGGTSSQFLKADGSVDSNTYVTGGPFLPLTGGTLTGALNGTTASFSSSLQTAGDISLIPVSGDININMKNSSGNATRVLTRQISTNNVFIGDIDSAGGKAIIRANGQDYLIVDINGNVGIGTSSPAYPLDIQSTSGALGISLRGRASDNISLFTFFNNAANTQLAKFTAASTYLGIDVGGSERMKITSGGKVTINTTLTEGFLNIDTKSSAAYNPNSYNGNLSNIYLTNGSIGSGRFSGINFAGGGSTEGFFGVVQNASTLAEFVFQTYNGSAYGERVRISSGGNFTINTLAGSGNRIVLANSGGTLISAVIGSGLAFDGTTLTATGGASGSISGSGTSGIIPVFTGGASIGNSVISQSGGNVLISSGNILNIYRTDNARALQLYTTGNECVVDAWEATSEPLMLRSNGSGGRIVFHTNAAERMRITSTSNVLIGTTADNSNKLRVNGTIFSDSSVTATSFFESSDATIKTLVEDSYQAKGIDSVVAKLYIKNGKQELGYYAQDLEGVLPSAVSKGSNGLLNLSYREVHTAKIAYLEQRIKQLENELLKPS